MARGGQSWQWAMVRAERAYAQCSSSIARGRGRRRHTRGGTRERGKKESMIGNGEDTEVPLLVIKTISITRGVRREKMARKKWIACRRAALLAAEFFSTTREGEASERRRRRKKKINKGRKERKIQGERGGRIFTRNEREFCHAIEKDEGDKEVGEEKEGEEGSREGVHLSLRQRFSGAPHAEKFSSRAQEIE